MFETDTVAGCCRISISTPNFPLSPIDGHCNFVNNAIFLQMYSTPFHPLLVTEFGFFEKHSHITLKDCLCLDYDSNTDNKAPLNFF